MIVKFTSLLFILFLLHKNKISLFKKSVCIMAKTPYIFTKNNKSLLRCRNTDYIEELKKYRINLTEYTEIYISSSGSDTEDLFEGRGFLKEKPFANLHTAMNFMSTYYNWQNQTVCFMLLSNVTLPTAGFRWQVPATTIIRSDSTTNYRTINLTNFLIFDGVGNITLNYLNFNGYGVSFRQHSNASLLNCNFTLSTNNSYGLHLFDYSSLEMNGTVNITSPEDTTGNRAIYVNTGSILSQAGTVITNGTFTTLFSISMSSSLFLTGAVNGTATGLRYSVTDNSTFSLSGKNPTGLPGSIEGVIDNSVLVP